jgi:hypothetical protein
MTEHAYVFCVAAPNAKAPITATAAITASARIAGR